MLVDTQKFVRGCPECAIVSGGGKVVHPPLHPIPVSHPFQILGVDVMDLPLTASGNKHVLVFQDLFTKWPMVYPIPDQKSEHIVKLLVGEIIPFLEFPKPYCLIEVRICCLTLYVMSVIYWGPRNSTLPLTIHSVMALWKGTIGLKDHPEKTRRSFW